MGSSVDADGEALQILAKRVTSLEQQLCEANAQIASAAEYGDRKLYGRIAELEHLRDAAEAALDAYRNMRKAGKSTEQSPRAANAKQLSKESFVLALDILRELCVKSRKGQP